jgi:hypothetical protein
VVWVAAFKGIKSKEEFVEILKKIDLEVGCSSIELNGEGNVVYFVAEEIGANKNRFTLSCAKIKTLEYRAFRKLREKLKGMTLGKSIDGLVKSYVD